MFVHARNRLASAFRLAPCRVCGPTTMLDASTSLLQCRCSPGFTKVESGNGSFTCECDLGMRFKEASDGEPAACLPCGLGQYKDTLGNVECLPCTMPRATTLNIGARTLTECICPSDSFRWLDNPDGATCEYCVDAHAPANDTLADVFGTNCTKMGTEVENLPLRQAFWRQSNASRIVRRCTLDENCLGGEAVGAGLCAA